MMLDLSIRCFMRCLLILLCSVVFVTSAYAQDSQNVQDTDGGVLINGVCWAATNVDEPGTFAGRPDAVGMLYQWGEKIGWSATVPMVSYPVGAKWDDAGSPTAAWLDMSDPCPEGWRVPTVEEWKSLCDESKVYSEWVKEGNSQGRRFTDRSSDASIFVPAAGFRDYHDGTLFSVSSVARYWSSTPVSSTAIRAYSLTFNDANMKPARPRYSGNAFSIRCVRR